jgi:hypothetical protein
MKAVHADLIQLVREMDACWHLLDELPGDHAWTQWELAALDDVRRAALRLANMAEVTIQNFQDFQDRRPSNG